MTDIKIGIREAHGAPGDLTKEDVWGTFDDDYNMISPGMIIARGYSTFTTGDTVMEDQIKSQQSKWPPVCPVWGDTLGYKSVTVKCKEDQVAEVSYWLEYVHGGGCIVDVAILPDGVALRSDYMCW